jgi:hypothetical protein
MPNHLKLILVLFLISFLPGFEAEAKNCSIPKSLATWGLEMPFYMTVVKNTSCATLILSTGQTSVVIDKPAENGVATALSNGARYKPNKDFVGSDEFVFVRNGLDRYGNPRESRVRVHVSVVNQ